MPNRGTCPRAATLMDGCLSRIVPTSVVSLKGLHRTRGSYMPCWPCSICSARLKHCRKSRYENRGSRWRYCRINRRGTSHAVCAAGTVAARVRLTHSHHWCGGRYHPAIRDVVRGGHGTRVPALGRALRRDPEEGQSL